MVSIFVFDFYSPSLSETILGITLLVILTAPLFFLHEIGHKINAQKFNLWAEFRLDPQGALITAISIILPIKFVAPGAVMIRVNDYSEVPAMGKVAGYGPAVNILLGGLYLIITGIFASILTFTHIDVSLLFIVFFYASGFSFFLGIFNMLPFGPLDGKKVKMWNNTAFWILFGVSAVLAVETYLGTTILLIISSFIPINYNPNGYFFIGSLLLNYDVALWALYPVVLGIIVFALGYYLLHQLADPAWDPGKEPIRYDDFRDYHYYDQTPSIKATRSSGQHSSTAPMNAPCAECGKRDLLPFKCTTCNKIYCAEHRLPGKHFCVVDSNYRR